MNAWNYFVLNLGRILAKTGWRVAFFFTWSRCSLLLYLAGILVLSYVYSKQPIFGLTQEWFRELSFYRLECVESTTSYTFPVQTGGIFYFPWHRHQIEGTNGFRCLIRKTQRHTISNVESQVFNLIITPSPSGIRTPVGGVVSGRANHYTTAPLYGGNSS